MFSVTTSKGSRLSLWWILHGLIWYTVISLTKTVLRGSHLYRFGSVELYLDQLLLSVLLIGITRASKTFLWGLVPYCVPVSTEENQTTVVMQLVPGRSWKNGLKLRYVINKLQRLKKNKNEGLISHAIGCLSSRKFIKIISKEADRRMFKNSSVQLCSFAIYMYI